MSWESGFFEEVEEVNNLGQLGFSSYIEDNLLGVWLPSPLNWLEFRIGPFFWSRRILQFSNYNQISFNTAYRKNNSSSTLC